MKRFVFFTTLFLAGMIGIQAQESISLDYDGNVVTKELQLTNKNYKGQPIKAAFSYNAATNQIKLTITPSYQKSKNRTLWFPYYTCKSNPDSILSYCHRDISAVTCIGSYYRSQVYTGMKRAFGCINCDWELPQHTACSLQWADPVDFFFNITDLQKPVGITLQNASVLQRKNFIANKKQRLCYVTDSIAWIITINVPPCETRTAKNIIVRANDMNKKLGGLMEEIKSANRSQYNDGLKECKKQWDSINSSFKQLDEYYEESNIDCPKIDTLLNTLSENIGKAKPKDVQRQTVTRPVSRNHKNIAKEIHDYSGKIINCFTIIKSTNNSNKKKEAKSECKDYIKKIDFIIDNLTPEESNNREIQREIDTAKKIKESYEKNYAN